MTETTLAPQLGATHRAGTLRIVQLLKLGLFGLGLGSVAIAFLVFALPRVVAEPSTVMLLGAGLGRNADHTSKTCNKPAKGHQRQATVLNMMGGNNTIRRSRGEAPIYKRPERTNRANAATAETTGNAEE